MARGNDKTALLSGIATATLDGPLMVPRGETVIVASSFEQARIAFEHVLAFMGDKLDDKRRWKVWDTAQQARIEDRVTGTRVRCIGSDPRRAHGLAPVLVLSDEPAQHPETTGEKMVAALRTAAGKQPHSRFVALGTRPADAEHWFAKMLAGGADYAQSHAARADDPPFRKRTWAKANPSLAAMPDLLDAIRNEAKQARLDPALLASFAALRLNLGTADTEVSVLLDAGLWTSIEGESTRAGPCVWGVDLGTSAAQSAVAGFWPETGRLECLAAFPNEPSLAERGLRDGVGGLYAECARRGELLTLGARAVDVAMLLQAALERLGRPSRVVADKVARGGATGRTGGRWSAASGILGARHGIFRRRGGRAGVPQGVCRWSCGSGAVAVAALGDGGSAHRFRPGGQLETGEGIARRAAPAGTRRCSGGGDLGGCGRCAATYAAAAPVAVPRDDGVK